MHCHESRRAFNSRVTALEAILAPEVYWGPRATGRTADGQVTEMLVYPSPEDAEAAAGTR